MAMKTQNTKRKAPETGKSNLTNASGNQEQIATAMLKADHRNVEQLFKKYEQLDDDGQKRDIARQICQELVIHTMLEEEIFYPACREKLGLDAAGEEALDEAQVEHDGAKTLINELLAGSPGSQFYDAKVTVLAEYIKHHVGEEEKPGDGIFARAEKAGLDMAALGQRLQARRSALMAKGKDLLSDPPTPRSLNISFNQGEYGQQDQVMNRPRNYRDQDERERHVGEYERSGSRGGYRSRHDDDNRGYGRQSTMSGHDDIDEDYGQGGGGRYSESQSHSRASHNPSEERYGSRDDEGNYGRGSSGWPEGHSRSSQRGGEGRGGGRYGGEYEGGSQDRGGGRYQSGREYQGGREYRGGQWEDGRGGYGDERRSYDAQSRGGGYGDDRSSGSYGAQPSRGAGRHQNQERDWTGGWEGQSQEPRRSSEGRGSEGRGGRRYRDEDDDERRYGRGSSGGRNWQNRD